MSARYVCLLLLTLGCAGCAGDGSSLDPYGSGLLPPALRISPESLDVLVGGDDSTTAELVLLNLGELPLQIDSMSTRAEWFHMSLDSLPVVIPPLEELSIQATFQGAYPVGALLQSDIEIRSNDHGQPDRILPISMEVVTLAVLGSSRDNTLYNDVDEVLSNGSGEWFFAGRTSDGRVRRGLILFDVANALPPGTPITAVQLKLFMSRTSVGSKPIALHRLTRDWGEGRSDAPEQEGNGTEARTGDATWEHAVYETVPWDTPGGDYVPEPSAEIAVGDVGWYTWESDQMAADVQGWVDDPATNFGWILIGFENTKSTTKRFNAREQKNEVRRPILTVVYDGGAR